MGLKYIKTYEEIGILSKGLESINLLKDKNSNKVKIIASKYLKMIYDDWNKNKDLFRVSINVNQSYTTLKYMITNGDQNDVQLGNRDEDAITIELMYISNIFSWTNDSTKARIEVSKFKHYIGDITIVGRDINTGDIFDDESGIKSDSLSYVNIPSVGVKKLINFFINKFKDKYPSMDKYFGARSILQIDKDLSKKMQDDESKRREIESVNREKKKMDDNKVVLSYFKNVTINEEDIKDYFIELVDTNKDRIIDVDIDKAIFKDNVVYQLSEVGFLAKKYNYLHLVEYDLNSNLNKNKIRLSEKDIEMEENIPYYIVMIEISSNEKYFESLNTEFKFKDQFDKVLYRFKDKLELTSSYLFEYDADFKPDTYIKYLIQNNLNSIIHKNDHMVYGALLKVK